MPTVLVKDAQRHGLRVRPIDIQVSDWACTIEHEVNGALSLRVVLGYAKGLRRQSAEAVVASRSSPDGTDFLLLFAKFKPLSEHGTFFASSTLRIHLYDTVQYLIPEAKVPFEPTTLGSKAQPVADCHHREHGYVHGGT